MNILHVVLTLSRSSRERSPLTPSGVPSVTGTWTPFIATKPRRNTVRDPTITSGLGSRLRMMSTYRRCPAITPCPPSFRAITATTYRALDPYLRRHPRACVMTPTSAILRTRAEVVNRNGMQTKRHSPPMDLVRSMGGELNIKVDYKHYDEQVYKSQCGFLDSLNDIKKRSANAHRSSSTLCARPSHNSRYSRANWVSR